MNRMTSSVIFLALALGGSIQTSFSNQELDTRVRDATAADLKSMRALRQAVPKEPRVAHAHGVVAWRNGNKPEAAEAIDAASTMGHPRDPDFVFNRAMVDVSRVTLAQRAASELSRFLADNPSFLNEEYIDLLGLAIQRIPNQDAAVAKEAAVVLEQKIQALTSIQNAEDGRGPRRKWGSAWVNSMEYVAIENSLARGRSKVEALRDADNKRETELAALNARLNASSDSYSRSSLKAQIAAKRSERTVIQSQIRDSEKASPKPVWVMGSPKWGAVPEKPNWDPKLDESGPPRVMGATLKPGMTEEAVAVLLGVEPESVEVGREGTVKVYILPDRRISVTFQNGVIVAFAERKTTTPQ